MIHINFYKQEYDSKIMKTPLIHEWTYDGILWKIGYRVVTDNLKSLGLRNNPNIVEYKINDWTYPVEKEVIEGISDNGGLWLARTIGSAKKYQRYMSEKHEKETRVFKSLIGKILYVNQDRIKTDKVFMFEELFLF